jgi:DNA-binding HxlR family transcriptional regulator
LPGAHRQAAVVDSAKVTAAGRDVARDVALSQAPVRVVCPSFHGAIELIGRRWSGAIVYSLLPGPMRFSEIAGAIPQISDRLLSVRLRELESRGLVARRVLHGAPVHVEYELTQMGRALEPTLAQLRAWAREWLDGGLQPESA